MLNKMLNNKKFTIFWWRQVIFVLKSKDCQHSIKLSVEWLGASKHPISMLTWTYCFTKICQLDKRCRQSCVTDNFKYFQFFHRSSALTEKIVTVLPKMQCPCLIEPHQIQGLDFIKIFPVIQWLVKRSVKDCNSLMTTTTKNKNFIAFTGRESDWTSGKAEEICNQSIPKPFPIRMWR